MTIMMATPEDFDAALAITAETEGVYSVDPDDPGNWTGGRRREGELKGTKYGISAASFPNLDIKNLSFDDARKIYRDQYWNRAGCPNMPPLLAAIVFDSAVNNGVGRAVRFVQQQIGLAEDGAFGPKTREALFAALEKDPDGVGLAGEVHARRIYYMTSLQNWRNHYGYGWSRRLAYVAIAAGRRWPKGSLVPPAPVAEREDRDVG